MSSHLSRHASGRRTSRLRPARLLGLGALLALLALSAGPTPAVVAGSGEPTSAERRTDYILNCLRFVHWPVEPDHAIDVVVLDDVDLSVALRRAAETRQVRGHDVTVSTDPRLVERGLADVVFAADRCPRADEIIRAATSGTRAVLTIGDGDAFTKAGGMLALVQRDDGLAVRVNMTAVMQSEIEICSRLLVVAELVESE